MFLQVCVDFEEDEDTGTGTANAVALGHLCPMCGRVAREGIPGMCDSRDDAATYELFTCSSCGAIMFLAMEQQLEDPGYSQRDLQAWRVSPAAMDANLVRKVALANKGNEGWWCLQVPLWRIRCARPALRGADFCTKGVGPCTEQGDEDGEDVLDTTIYWCDSFSLCHPRHPFVLDRASFEHYRCPLVPELLGSHVVHVFLEPLDGAGGAAVPCSFEGGEGCGYDKWQRAAFAALQMPLTRGSSDDDSDSAISTHSDGAV
jgi:hypothetical protein